MTGISPDPAPGAGSGARGYGVPVARPNDDEHWWDPKATPAATVVVLRDRDELEVLVLRRDDSLGFAGGAWVFPGGRIDPEDHAACADGDLEQAARRAAVREAAEEAGLVLDEDRLHRWSHWTPPSRAGRRFTTAFFCTSVDGDEAIVVDDGEIRAHRWARPTDLLAARDAGEVSLTPPTFITLSQLAPHRDAAAAIAHAGSVAPEHFATRIAVDGDEWIALYHGDVAYEAAADDPPPAELLHAPGGRHRLTMGATWTYRRSDADDGT